MNLMGRIFTLLIFFLSITFLVIAVMVGASHRNWKKSATVNKDIAALAQRQLDSSRNSTTEKKKQLAAERVSRMYQLAQLESQLVIQRRLRNATQAQLRDELVLSQQRMTNLEKVEERLAELDQEIAQLKSQNSVLIDDVAEQRKQVVNKTNSLYNVESEKEELEQLVQDLSSEVAQRRKVMTHLGVDLDQLVKHIAPKVDGVVTGVDSNIIVVSLGRDDGLRRDHKVDIFRGDRFVATAVVLTANHNISSARILPEFQLSKVREGDHVTTKL